MSAEDRAALANAILGQEFKGNDPLSQLMLLSKDGKRYFQVLGADWYAFTGVERLCAVSASPIPLYPLSPLEKLIAHMPSVHESYHRHELLDEFTMLQENDLRAAQAAGGFHGLSVFQQCSDKVRLAMYQWSAWNKSLSGLASPTAPTDIGRDIRVWDAAPAYVRLDPLMQQIVGLQRPILLQECMRREPLKQWDFCAVAISLKRTGIPAHLPWYRWMNNDAFGLLMQTGPGTTDHPVLHRTSTHLYQFPEEKLGTLLTTNPALFVHGVVHSRLLRESSAAKAWFLPMLEASFKKVQDDAWYSSTLLSVRESGPKEAAQFDAVVQALAPEYARLISVHQSLHSGDAAYHHWAQTCAQGLVPSIESVELPPLEPLP